MSNKQNRKRMMHLKTETMPASLTPDNLDEYFNITGSKLDKSHKETFSLVFGDVLSIERAINYALGADMRAEDLTSEDFIDVEPESRHKHIPNFWAYVAYLITERVMQDPELKDALINARDVCYVEERNVKLFGQANFLSIVRVPTGKMYTGVTRAVRDAVRASVDDSDAINNMLQNMKMCKDKSVFHGMPFVAEFL